MKPFELKNAIKSKKPLKALLLGGECEIYIDKITKDFFDTFGVDEYEKFYFDEASVETIRSTLSQPSLFSPLNAALVKTDKKFKPSEIKELFSICSKNENTYLVIEYLKTQNSEDWEFNKEIKALEAEADKIEFCAGARIYPPYPEEAVSILSDIAKESGKELDKTDLYTIYNSQGQNLSLASIELKKRILHSFEGGAQESYSLNIVTLDDLIDSMLERKDFHQKLQRVLEEGYQPIEIVIALQARFRDIFYFYAYIVSFGDVNKKEITGFYNYPEHLAKKNSDLALKLKGDRINSIFSTLMECSLKIKEGKGDSLSHLIASLMKIQASL